MANDGFIEIPKYDTTCAGRSIIAAQYLHIVAVYQYVAAMYEDPVTACIFHIRSLNEAIVEGSRLRSRIICTNDDRIIPIYFNTPPKAELKCFTAIEGGNIIASN